MEKLFKDCTHVNSNNINNNDDIYGTQNGMEVSLTIAET